MKSVKNISCLLLFNILLPLISCARKDIPSSSHGENTNMEQTLPLVHFNVTSPIDIPENANIKLAGDFNGWNPLDEAYVLTHVNARNYTYTLNLVPRILAVKFNINMC